MVIYLLPFRFAIQCETSNLLFAPTIITDIQQFSKPKSFVHVVKKR